MDPLLLLEKLNRYINIKAAIIALLLLSEFNLNSSAQTIGDRLDYIKSVLPGGDMFDMGSASTKMYRVVDGGGTFAYICDESNYCIKILLYPHNSTALGGFEKELNTNWVREPKDSTWRLDRTDGYVLHAALKTTSVGGYVFILRPYKEFLQEEETMKAVKAVTKIK